MRDVRDVSFIKTKNSVFLQKQRSCLKVYNVIVRHKANNLREENKHGNDSKYSLVYRLNSGHRLKQQQTTTEPFTTLRRCSVRVVIQSQYTITGEGSKRDVNVMRLALSISAETTNTSTILV
ncbi:hypothetical protein J6590_059668 [Homalodisca vitripennis]|nr:hypothetical protein J6590_059668 [Homalodisca vitripennis]